VRTGMSLAPDRAFMIKSVGLSTVSESEALAKLRAWATSMDTVRNILWTCVFFTSKQLMMSAGH